MPKRSQLLISIFTLLVLLFAVLPAAPAYAAGITATTNADTMDANSGTCTGMTISDLPGADSVTSLREAICAANGTAGADTITFAGNYTITLTSELPDIITEMTIKGAGYSVTVNGDNNTYRILFVDSGGTLTLNSLTLLQGNPPIVSFGNLTVLHSTIRDGSGDDGGIYMGGSQLIIANSTFYNNHGLYAGAIAAGIGVTTVNINNSTFSGNGGSDGVILGLVLTSANLL